MSHKNQMEVARRKNFAQGKTRGERIFYAFNFTLISCFGYSLFLFWMLSIYYLLNCFSNLFSEFEKEENKFGSKGFFLYLDLFGDEDWCYK
jgi:hypothetical protein